MSHSVKQTLDRVVPVPYRVLCEVARGFTCGRATGPSFGSKMTGVAFPTLSRAPPTLMRESGLCVSSLISLQ
jgi:hypothetical protein